MLGFITSNRPRRLRATVTPIRTATGKAGKAIKVGRAPVAIAITP